MVEIGIEDKYWVELSFDLTQNIIDELLGRINVEMLVSHHISCDVEDILSREVSSKNSYDLVKIMRRRPE